MRHWITGWTPLAVAFSGLVLLALLVQGAPAAVAQPAAGADDEAMREAQAAHYAQQSLRVNVWVDKGTDEVYSRGEVLRVGFQTNEDAYLVVYHIDVDGRVSVLWPTSRFNDGFVFGNHEYLMPVAGGPVLRVGADEGVGYVNAVASRYPFDLRDIDVDFHHEPETPPRDFFVAGDPFLAMNEVNYAVTGLEDPSEYVVTNYASYYVHRAVDHPRYLCLQCHDDGRITEAPYDSECTIVIHYDYDWSNQWWDHYGYFPAYYYPVYFYLDPWTWSPWVNYWYRPWYAWPYCDFYGWNTVCYDWHYSPYWHGDCAGDWSHGNHRYRPLDKTDLGRHPDGGGVRTKSPRVTEARPDDARLAAMKERTVVREPGRVLQRDEARGVDGPSGGVARGNVAANARSTTKFSRGDGERSAAGLRIPEGRATGTRRGDVGSQFDTKRSPGRESTGTTSRDGLRGGDDARIRPLEPRDGSNQTWSGRRSTQHRTVDPAKPADRPREGTRSRIEKSGGTRGREASPSAPPSSRGGGDRGSSGGGGRSDAGGGSAGGSRGGGGGGGSTRGGR